MTGLPMDKKKCIYCCGEYDRDDVVEVDEKYICLGCLERLDKDRD